MNQLTPEFLARSREVFKETWPSLADVHDQILNGDQSIRRRDTLSAFLALEKYFKIDLSITPATWPVLRRIFAGKSATQIGISAKRYANIRSDIFRAVKQFGVPSPNLTHGPTITSDWKTLLTKVDAANYRASLRRLACYCSAMGISPNDVGKESLLGFHEALEAEGGVKDPKIILRHVTSYWNYHHKRIADWPNIRLQTPFPTTRYRLAIAELPPELQKHIANWQERRAGGDLLSLDKAVTESRPKTIQHQTEQLLRYIGLIVQYHLADLHELTSFRALVEPQLVQSALKLLLERQKRTLGYVHQYAYLLLAIARHDSDLPEGEVKRLATLAANLRSKLMPGMTKKNRLLLRQFDNPENIEKLIQFSDGERARGRKESNPHRQAKYYERALVADILIHGALRIENVAMLRTDRNMRKRGASYILTYVGEEMKNGHSHETELPDWMSDHIEEFISKYRPRLQGANGSYLFPGKLDGARHYSAIRMEFTRTIKKRTGLNINPHFVRHLTSKLALEKDPSMLLTVSRRLGHRSIETTQKAYLETDTLSASREFNNMDVLGKKSKPKSI